MIESTVATLGSSTLADGGFWKTLFFRGSGQATYSKDVDFLFMSIWWLSVVCFLGLMSLMVFFVIKYRRRPGVPAMQSKAHNTPLEIAWTVIPTIIFVFIFFGGFYAYAKQHVAPGNSLKIDLTAKKWNWNLIYPNGASSTELTRLNGVDVPIFMIPEDTPIELQMTSTDVIHSFWVPDFRMKIDVIPNRYTNYWFQAEPLKEGETSRDHWVFCAEYCGDNHSEMGAILRVVSKEDFAKWLKEPFDGAMPLADVGKVLYGTKGCASCHSVDGSANTGPTWKDLYGSDSTYADGSTATMDANQIRNSILDPSSQIRQGFTNQMPTYQGQINAREMAALIAYMRTISANAPASDIGQTWGETAPEDPNAATGN